MIPSQAPAPHIEVTGMIKPTKKSYQDPVYMRLTLKMNTNRNHNISQRCKFKKIEHYKQYQNTIFTPTPQKEHSSIPSVRIGSAKNNRTKPLGFEFYHEVITSLGVNLSYNEDENNNLNFDKMDSKLNMWQMRDIYLIAQW